MIVSGTGSSGLAIVILKESEGDEYRKEILGSQASLLPRAEKDSVLRIALKPCGWKEKLSAAQVRELGPDLFTLLGQREIRVVIAVGRVPFNLLTGRSGSEERVAGAVIHVGPFDAAPTLSYVIPCQPPWAVEVTGREFLRRVFVRGMTIAHSGYALGINWVNFHTEPNIETLQALQAVMHGGDPVAIDIETAGTDILNVPITAIGIANPYQSISVPWEGYVAGRFGEVAPIDSYPRGSEIAELVIDILRSDVPKIFHNGQYDLIGLRARGIEVNGPIEDTLLMHRIIYPDRLHNLQTAMLGEYGVEPWKTNFKQEVGDFIEHDHKVLRLYNAKDAAATIGLYSALGKHLCGVHHGHLLYEQYLELSKVAAQMQEYGWAINTKERDEMHFNTQMKMMELVGEWNTLTGGDVLLGKTGSTPAVKRFFFETLMAPVIERSKKTGEPSLSAAALMEYMGDSRFLPYARCLFRYKKNAKLLTAFLQPMAGKQRVHATYKVWGTKGARWSSSGPNMQQASKEKEVTYVDGLKEIVIPNLRPIFIADPGFTLIEADYSALELRIVAHLAKMDEVLYWLDMDRREPGKWDPHTLNARLMFGRPDITKKDPLRQITKTLTFAMFYNFYRGVDTVYRALKPSMPSLTLRQLEGIQKRFYAVRKELPLWQESIAQETNRRGYVEAPIYGRRQYHEKGHVDVNQALSFPVQSTAGDLTNRAILEVAKFLDWQAGQQIRAQVHDALIVQCHKEDVPVISELLRMAMEAPVLLFGNEVRFPVDIKSGSSWGTMKELSL